MKQFFYLVLLFIFLPFTAKAELFNCQGDLIVFGFTGDRLLQLNSRSYSNFSVDREKYIALSLVFDSEEAFAKIYPWNGIDYIELKDAKNKKIEVSFHSDKENWFSLIAKKDSKSKSLKCKFIQF
ncbi:MAG: hypothetical protein KDD58_07365 [Bdellovibrionales bacterium]|nr:hypothetical protein [Bdellovibrionales bacterium]